MSSPVVSRWPVLLPVPVEDGDRAPTGALSRAGAERMFALARDAYFARCRSIDVGVLTAHEPSIRLRPGAVGDLVTVSAGVVEIFPESFRMSARVRAAADVVAADVTCTFSTLEPIPASMRDEFIALAHSAAHIH